ncbi:MAG: ADP-ribosylglycohydrolase family protein, partial [Bacteroidales bacterium]
MKKYLFYFSLLALSISCSNPESSNNIRKEGDLVSISKDALKDKIKGAWAGQTIGVTYGGPTEFQFNGTMIQDYVPIPWYDGVVKWWYENAPGLYDDIYMDLTFVDVFDRLGLDAPADSFAMAFATADYVLWHANQAARVNILKGIMPPESGHWKNNPHADCIDYQIEADFAGIMSPGMVNTASEISDRIGHIMNYGDGWYGGVYVGAMYSLAFISDDIEFIVKEALKTIPEQSQFYQCVNEVIENYYKFPDDWKRNWFEV